MKADIRGLFYYAYTIIDLFDRRVVGWSIGKDESDEHSTRLFTRVVRELEVLPQIFRADNNHPMRGEAEAAYAARNRTIANARDQNPLRWWQNRIYSYQSNPVSFPCRPLIQAAR